MGYLSQLKMENLGLRYLGKNVKISENAILYNPCKISIGDNSRIDDFCIISASEYGIFIDKFVHIAAFCSIQGMGKVTLEDFSGLSSRVAIYASSDDYSGLAMTNPCVAKEFTNVISGPVTIKKHAIIGVSSCILPNVEIGIGSAIGAFSLVSKSIENSAIAVGVPAKFKVPRKQNIFELEKEFLKSISTTKSKDTL